ncbi:hypothetical protein ISN45_At05g030310 [Arabidopsis thaliana x Arabidopsis arenosa]|uniref:Uncharacterized protein n=1 Tax=Arabidopsis thaliana x Arabidopsis arenosa TaxID=1240361 RepID=A0A8T2D4J8_9BRAS|nr:hypothetical protein ISN45_At05g030310 [Arabidopsis thaliana x Arabidopsis arenosa]
MNLIFSYFTNKSAATCLKDIFTKFFYLFAISPESFHEITPVAEVTVAIDVEATAGHRNGGNSGDGKKKCVCSPSKHPRSFKCRYHQHEYQWLPSSSFSSLHK